MIQEECGTVSICTCQPKDMDKHTWQLRFELVFNVGDDVISALLISVPVPNPTPMATVAAIIMEMITAFIG